MADRFLTTVTSIFINNGDWRSGARVPWARTPTLLHQAGCRIGMDRVDGRAKLRTECRVRRRMDRIDISSSAAGRSLARLARQTPLLWRMGIGMHGHVCRSTRFATSGGPNTLASVGVWRRQLPAPTSAWGRYRNDTVGGRSALTSLWEAVHTPASVSSRRVINIISKVAFCRRRSGCTRGRRVRGLSLIHI